MECGNPAAACFRQYARLIHRRSDALREDAMIAANARVRGLTIATRSERWLQDRFRAGLQPISAPAPLLLAARHVLFIAQFGAFARDDSLECFFNTSAILRISASNAE